MAKRANGEGTIRKRSDGRWEGRYYDPVADKQRSIYRKTQKEVREELARIAVEKDVGRFVSKTKMTLDEWFEFYVTHYKVGYVKPQTVANIRYNYQNHIQPYIGQKEITSITTLDIQIVLKRASTEYTKGTVKNAKIVLVGVFKQAVKNKIIPANPVSDAELPRDMIEPQSKRELTESELYWFFRGLREKCSTATLYFELLLTTGARRGEITALRWENISDDYSTLHIDSTYVQYVDPTTHHTQCTVNSPKTTYSERTIPIHNDLREQLKEAKATARFVAKQFGRPFSESDYIFINPATGKLRDVTYIDCVIKKVRTYLKGNYGIELPKMTPHYFRHTFASRCMRKGVSMETLKELLGHSNYDMISTIYAHASDTDKAHAIGLAFDESVILGSNCGQTDAIYEKDHN